MEKITIFNHYRYQSRPTCHLGVEKCEGNNYCDVICHRYYKYRSDIIFEKCCEMGMTDYQTELCNDWTDSKRLERKKEAINEYIDEFKNRILYAAYQWKNSLIPAPGIINIKFSKKHENRIIEICEIIGCQEWYAKEIFEAIEMSKMPECLCDIFFKYCSTQYHVYGKSEYNINGHPNGYINLIKFIKILNGDNLDDEKFGMWGTMKKESNKILKTLPEHIMIQNTKNILWG